MRLWLTFDGSFIMKITYVSNYINHHVKPLCDILYKELSEDFVFVETSPMTAERKKLGWRTDEDVPYLKRLYEKEQKNDIESLISESDILMLGWSELSFELVKKRILSKKITLRLSERIYKEGQWKFISPGGLISKYKEHIKWNKYPVYMLCIGGYTAADFRLIHAYKNKLFRWGYFTKTEDTKLSQWDNTRKIKICWAGRMMDLKHPEYVLSAYNKLLSPLSREEKEGYQLVMIGDGALRGGLEKYVRENKLEKYVKFTGNIKPREVRAQMESSHIFVMTSNYLEGWGAVINEAMNSGCAVLSSDEAGATPYLIKDNINGYSYKGGSYKEFEKKFLNLFKTDISELKIRAVNGKNTVSTLWSEKNAAKRLLEFCGLLLKNEKPVIYDDDGPLSKAPYIKAPGILRTLREKNKQD